MAAKKCSKCGEEKPLEKFYKFKYGKFGRQPECKVCSNARRRAFADARPDLERKQRREWAQKHPPTEQQKARKAAYRAARKEWMRRYSAAWYEKNKDRLKPVRAEWHSQNYPKRKPKMVQNQANRRARLRDAHGSHTIEQVLALYERQRGRCACCRTSLAHGYHRDHMTALAVGGSNDISNIQLLCPACNMAKKAKDPIEFMQGRGYLL